MEISDNLKCVVSVQDYTSKTKIKDVMIIDLPLFTDDGGSFTELFRADTGCFTGLGLDYSFEVAQANYAQVLPGVIKAFHLHYNQEDIWFILPNSRLLVGLYDARKGSLTEGRSMRLVMGAGKAQLLYIPRGVAHGLANPYNETAHMIYFVNNAFNINNPDERRLKWDYLSESFWEVTKG